MSTDEFAQESDKSPGVLLASGYIAGGAIAGIIIAILQGVPAFEGLNDAIEKWANVYNPFYNGPWSDALTLIPFIALTGFLYLVARGRLLVPRSPPVAASFLHER
jgi:hypothetical protein